MGSGGTNKERYQGKAWALMLGTNGNASFVENLAKAKAVPKGEIQRVIETRLEKVAVPEDRTLALNMAVVNNHGHAGEVIVQEILKDVKAAEELVFKFRKLVIARAGLTDQNRNWSANAACNLAAAVLAKRCGFWNIDLEALTDWTVARLRIMKLIDSSLDIDIHDLIKNYYFEKQGQIIRIKSTQDGRHKDDSGLTDTFVNPEKLPHYAWVGRYEYDIKRLYLLIKPFKDWLRRGKHSPGQVEEEITKHMLGVKRKVHLGKGTTVNIGSVYVLCLEFDAGDEDEDQLDIPKNLESLYEPKA